MSIGDPSQREEGSGNLVQGQEVQQPVHTWLDSALKTVPLGALDVGLECRNLKVFFDVDREEVSDAGQLLILFVARKLFGSGTCITYAVHVGNHLPVSESSCIKVFVAAHLHG